MAKFLNYLQTQQKGQQFTLLSTLRYDADAKGFLEVPAGYVTDFASLKVFHNALLFVIYALLVTYGNRAATLHDWLYSKAMYPRKVCDEIFYQALRADGVARWRAWLFYAGVRIGGSSYYGKD